VSLFAHEPAMGVAVVPSVVNGYCTAPNGEIVGASAHWSAASAAVAEMPT